jgi:hypothetical protein
MHLSPSKNENSIHFTGSELGPKRHICGFFRNAEEEYRFLLPFFKEG